MLKEYALCYIKTLRKNVSVNGELKIDSHIHTWPKSSCSIMSPEQAVRAAIRAGLDAMVITEHDNIWSDYELNGLREQFDAQIRIFAGVEVACREGHFLVLGINDNRNIYFDMPAKELISFAHKNLAAVIVAHPYRYSIENGDISYNLDIDGVEIDSNNTNAHTRPLAEKLADHKNIFRLISSDAHEIDVVGKYYTSFPQSINTIKDLAAYILDSRYK
ncbi:PHP domain-containing protein [Candidatus Magnetoovum chiemensis]|nr:PHP domain-containing protein [Candidatus Magnetoovum chiemensis]